MNDCDVLIIGGGPAGLMAAAAAGRQGARVLLLEKGDRLGRKLIISGGGRCNVTNRKPVPDLIAHIPGNGRFLYSALSTFGSEEIISFFAGLGVKLKEEDRGRMFPATDRAATVAQTLIAHLRDLGVGIRTGARVERLTLGEGRCCGAALAGGGAVHAGAVVVAVGGTSVPKTGSTGDGYAWAQQAGHTVTPLYPTEVPLTAADPWILDRSVQGLSLSAVTQTLYDPAGKKVTTQEGDMIFTHFGLSGPVSLRTSHYVSVTHLRRGPQQLRLAIDLFPGQSSDDLYHRCLTLAEAEPKKAIRNVWKALLPERLLPVLLGLAELDGQLTAAHLPREGLLRLSRLLKALPVTVTGTLPLADAFVTGGGVSVKEVDPKTMASRLVPGLYFAGEVLDVHAHTGGYNITVAFATGYTAGQAAAAAVVRAGRARLSSTPGVQR